MTPANSQSSVSHSLIEAVIRSRSDDTSGIAVIEFAAPDGSAFPDYSPGAHIEVVIGEDLVRQYSLCNSPEMRGRYRIAVLHDPASRGGSKAIHEQFHVGRKVRISPPRNHFLLHHGPEKALLLGGGIGITPVLAMAYALLGEGRTFELHYCVRSRATAGLLDELGSFGDALHVHADDESEGRFLDIAGLLDRQPADTHLYVCGPTGFMDAAIECARAKGWPEARIHFEYFSANVETDGQPFTVEARKSGKVIAVDSQETILAALAREGIKVPKSCEQGVCGTCICDVIEGEIDHRDSYLSPEEREDGDQIVTCCSRAKSDLLVLDI